MKWFARVDVSERKASKTKIKDEMERWGGRLFIAKILTNEVPPTCEPLGRYNKLIIASGLLGDTPVTTSGKISIGGKSPLTGGIKESNVGGFAGKRLANLGIRAVIIEGLPRKPGTDMLIINSKGIELVPVPELRFKLVSDTIKYLRTHFGNDIGIFCIGPAGEMLMSGAGIASPDNNDIQIRYAARGGLGALMGSKGIKAIVVDDSNSKYKPEYFDRELLTRISREIIDDLKDDPKTENRHLYGTPAIISLANKSGLLPTKNFSVGQFEYAEEISGETIRKVIAERGKEGRSGTPCVPGCFIKCSNVFPDKKGKKIVASLQYENIIMLGPNCGIGNLDDIAEMDNLCNEVGVDAIETGAALGVAMEAGLMKFGDAKNAKDMITQIGKGTVLGRVIGNGAYITGKVLGVQRVPVIKKQGVPAYDPRALKGNGVTYFTSPMGPDHTAGNAFETLKTTDPLGIEQQVENSRRLQVRAAILDSFGLCIFVRPAFVRNPEFLFQVLKGRYGWDLKIQNVLDIGMEVLKTERKFNSLAGVSEDSYSMPEFMMDEPLPPTNSRFDISLEKMKSVWDIKQEIF
ncbi:MAG: aldehyde ferredoxin oxidoreductase [Spirochaetota bacterium]|nr:MAG: aldehyde ferredoxin oxidoreductase [Spirochaetota bacterium]